LSRGSVTAFPKPISSNPPHRPFANDTANADCSARGINGVSRWPWGADDAIGVAGTGSIGVGLVGGRELRFGRYSFPISDEGRGAGIGLQAIRRVLHAADQRGETSPLLNEVLAAFDPSTPNCFDRTVMQEALLRVRKPRGRHSHHPPRCPDGAWRPIRFSPRGWLNFKKQTFRGNTLCVQCGKFLSEVSSIDHGVGAGHARLSLSPYRPWPSSVTESSERSRQNQWEPACLKPVPPSRRYFGPNDHAALSVRDL
jgi:hypothetical protein